MRASQRAADLARQMLAFCCQGRIIVKDLNLNEFVTENSSFFNAAIAKTITFNLQLDPDIPLIKGDATQIRIRPDVRVLLSSGFSKKEISERFVGEGLAGFIEKPYTLESLRDELTRVFKKDEAIK